MKPINLLILSILLSVSISCCSSQPQKENTRQQWSVEQAKSWANNTEWLNGCNYIPHTAINSIEMWQKETFDPATIDQEFKWAQSLGFTSMRVFLNSLVWKDDPAGFKERIEKFLQIADNHHIKTMFVFFDDCWNPESHLGKQPEPKPGVHNSGWVQDPNAALRSDTTALFSWLKEYVQDIIGTYKNDPRVAVWDLYNEPGGGSQGLNSLPLLKNVFKWAREINPTQPITSGIWAYSEDFRTYNIFQAANSDILSYHNYANPKEHSTWIETCKIFNEGRPMICTEWMARSNNSLFNNILPILKKEHIGAYCWGFVAGKTNTIYGWGQPIPDGSEPKIWHHDIMRPDGTFFDDKEAEIIKEVNKQP